VSIRVVSASFLISLAALVFYKGLIVSSPLHTVPSVFHCSYSIALSILDMNAVVNHTLSKIALSRASEGTSASPALEASRTTLDHQIHLFGHSYGGSLAYEYVKFQQHAQAVDSEPVQSRNPMSPSSSQTVCRSLILCNAIQNMKRANDDYDRLYEENPKGFWTQHACREGIPPPLQDALNHLGTAWNGMTSVLDYVATPIPKSSSHPPSTLLLWGGRDFGLRASHDKVWKSLLDGGELEVVQFKDCAHYPFYEDKEEFARVLEGYLKRMDAR
jgi:pimeloyl-ACP methyl ester carboxylesterase